MLPTSQRLPVSVYEFANNIVKKISKRYDKNWKPKNKQGKVVYHNQLDKIDFIGEEINYVRFESLSIPDKALAVSYHYFGRIFFEFLSPSWFFNEQLDFLDNAERLLAELA